LYVEDPLYDANEAEKSRKSCLSIDEMSTEDRFNQGFWLDNMCYSLCLVINCIDERNSFREEYYV